MLSIRDQVGKMNHHKGFTLIELMAVVAIVSILSVIAIAAYSEYVVRSKVSEGMVFASEAKTSVSEYYYNVNKMPRNNSEAGLASTAQYELSSYNFVHFVQVTNTPKEGTISVKFKIVGSRADNKFLWLIPSTVGGIVSWTCLPADVEGIDVNHIPPNCRGG
jgi:type IV pilus assembly protein PilA